MTSIQTFIQTWSHWIAQNPFTGAGVLFGGAVLAVTLFTYVHDYRMLVHRD